MNIKKKIDVEITINDENHKCCGLCNFYCEDYDYCHLFQETIIKKSEKSDPLTSFPFRTKKCLETFGKP
jgi:hypothetical protein